jgi:hypothetical protein
MPLTKGLESVVGYVVVNMCSSEAECADTTAMVDEVGTVVDAIEVDPAKSRILVRFLLSKDAE